VARAQWSVIDYVPIYVPGMVFTLRDSTNAIVTFITDNVGADSDPVGGKFDIDGDLGTVVVKPTQAGTYSICETVPPNGYWNAQPACKQVQVAAAEAGWAEWFINQEKQVYKP